MSNLPRTVERGFLPTIYEEMPTDMVAHHGAFRCHCGEVGNLLSGIYKQKLTVYFQCAKCGESIRGTDPATVPEQDGTLCHQRLERKHTFDKLRNDMSQFLIAAEPEVMVLDAPKSSSNKGDPCLIKSKKE